MKPLLSSFPHFQIEKSINHLSLTQLFISALDCLVFLWPHCHSCSSPKARSSLFSQLVNTYQGLILTTFHPSLYLFPTYQFYSFKLQITMSTDIIIISIQMLSRDLKPDIPTMKCLTLTLHYFFGQVRGGSEVKASASIAGDPGSIPESGRSPGEGNGNPLQYSCLENPMDGEAWQAIVHGVTKSQT